MRSAQSQSMERLLTLAHSRRFDRVEPYRRDGGILVDRLHNHRNIFSVRWGHRDSRLCDEYGWTQRIIVDSRGWCKKCIERRIIGVVHVERVIYTIIGEHHVGWRCGLRRGCDGKIDHTRDWNRRRDNVRSENLIRDMPHLPAEIRKVNMDNSRER